ncbi:DUF4376 domain-containing protein [Salmonella enterica]|uniref:DUF4376 domain-containing protein n=2 Tax=Salmonella enterica TaxID=28901 RepID=A0A8E7SNZ6_SALER|nr:DUF4376 domain-containing protein [Salmonella enterica]EAB6759026.1 DUF4376 domain-containing protein [Salmonella enterica subsp. enterica serovar Enteritidis]EBW3286074.1 DUF4376 domain-containing protein [Salmonella enterica subsp. enterica serovar Typhimurium]EGX5312583.1 DUF4376 domain-containing protein [Salmonella enterica subsp. enterica serovar Stanley]EAO0413201.1 DUF4376 domain-containing protein [Salmonella enterica]EAQ5245139.1 DUF4376 domain-containing protein [Salmonella enter
MSEIAAIRNARYLENGAVDCEVLFSDLANFLPYTATSTDSAETGRRVWQELQSGKWGDIAPFNVTKEMLEAAKAAKHQEIEAWREQQESQPFTFEWNGHTWNAGPDSLSRLSPVTVAAKAENARDVFVWGDASNQQVHLTMAQAGELAAAMAQASMDRNNEIYLRQREMKEALEKLCDLGSIREMTISNN